MYLPRTPLLKSSPGRSARGSGLADFLILSALCRGSDARADETHAGVCFSVNALCRGFILSPISDPTLRKGAKDGAPECRRKAGPSTSVGMTPMLRSG